MTTIKKNVLSCCTLVLFALFALSSKVNKIHYGAFNYSNRVEDPTELKNYLLMNDGTKVYGDGEISWKSGMLVKDQVRIGDQKFKITEVRGYLSGGTFYGRLGNSYIKRIVHGKVNVYVQFSTVTETTTDHSGFVHTHSYTRTDQYGQKGEDGAMVVLAGQDDIKKLLSDCPLSVEMASLSNSQMRKAIRKNPNYMNEIFDVYNSDCRAVHKDE